MESQSLLISQWAYCRKNRWIQAHFRHSHKLRERRKKMELFTIHKFVFLNKHLDASSLDEVEEGNCSWIKTKAILDSSDGRRAFDKTIPWFNRLEYFLFFKDKHLCIVGLMSREYAWIDEYVLELQQIFNCRLLSAAFRFTLALFLSLVFIALFTVFPVFSPCNLFKLSLL